MKTLVIHPDDRSTDFLKPVYAPVPNKTIITGCIGVEALADLIRSHDRIMMMGHGSPWGLLSVGRFPGSGMHIIDNDTASLLKRGDNNIYIWCHADEFVRAHQLEGFFTGMFISETGEAAGMGLTGTCEEDLNQSNESFSMIAGRYINESSVRGAQYLWENIRRDYGLLAGVNRVARYNHERLYFITGRASVAV